MTSELKPCPFCLKTKHLKTVALYTPEFDGYYGFNIICDAAGFDGFERGCGSAGAWGETENAAAMVWSTRAVPDVPELVRYTYDTWPVSWCLDNVEMVNADQAAEIIAAKDKEIERLSKRSCDNGFCNTDDWHDRAKAAETKLAQKPVAYRYRCTNVNGELLPDWYYKEEVSALGLPEEPLYASPAPCPDLKAENDKLREALRETLPYVPEHHGPIINKINHALKGNQQ